MKKVFLSAIMSVLTIFSLGAVSTLAPKPAHAANNTIICPDGEPVTVPTNVTAETGYGKLCEAHGGGTQGIFSNVNMMNTLNTVAPSVWYSGKGANRPSSSGIHCILSVSIILLFHTSRHAPGA